MTLTDTQITRERLVAAVVTHQRLPQLQTTVRALLAQPGADLAAVLVVDNASTDGTADWLAQQQDPRLVVVHSADNLGGAGGFALGMRHAMETLSPDWIVVMDDDARPEPGAFAAFHALDMTGYDGFAAAVRHPDGTICEMNRPTYNPFWHKKVLARTLLGGGRGAFHLGPKEFATPGLRAVDGASFVGFFVRARTINQRGYPDPRLFLYGDDAIYTMSLTRAGHRIGFDPSVRFEHDSSTYSVADPRIRPLWKVYYYHRNLLILYRIATGIFFVPVLLLYVPRWLLKLRHYPGERRRFLRLFALALRDGLLGRTTTPHAAVLAIVQDATVSE
ncbi:glycosyltransferase [Pararhodobacter sp.]|uniref:glycosyltransferase n=1 Tax=Pararhodobacter sp. TaxID=2127056 RepID=UPI002B0013C8|nr:glycosyltransferase [Pararhodobacter sp.]